jgi:DNA-binding transcriptional ArsR family regulator
MSYETALQALADPTRRAIVEILRDRPQTVGVLADRFPVSRPAISQHLKVLSDAGIVEAEARGAKRIYRLSPDGIGALRRYLNTLWDEALGAYETEARGAELASRRSPFD